MPANDVNDLSKLRAQQAVQPMRQQYIASILDDKPNELIDPLDFPTIRKRLYDNTITAVQKRFPLYNERYSLGIENLQYADPEEVPLKDQKLAIMEGKSVGRRLRGSWVLKDMATGKTIQKTGLKTLLKVPYLTERGTFIKNGAEYTFNHIMRMQPGVYATKKPDKMVAQFNAKQGTGSRMDVTFVPSTGIFTMVQGTKTVPAYRVFRDMGITDDQMKTAWGEDLWKLNKLKGSDMRAKQAAMRFYGMEKNQNVTGEQQEHLQPSEVRLGGDEESQE